MPSHLPTRCHDHCIRQPQKQQNCGIAGLNSFTHTLFTPPWWTLAAVVLPYDYDRPSIDFSSNTGPDTFDGSVHTLDQLAHYLGMRSGILASALLVRGHGPASSSAAAMAAAVKRNLALQWIACCIRKTSFSGTPLDSHFSHFSTLVAARMAKMAKMAV